MIIHVIFLRLGSLESNSSDFVKVLDDLRRYKRRFKNWWYDI